MKGREGEMEIMMMKMRRMRRKSGRGGGKRVGDGGNGGGSVEGGRGRAPTVSLLFSSSFSRVRKIPFRGWSGIEGSENYSWFYL